MSGSPSGDTHPTNPADKETKCPMEKSVRLRIAARFPGRLPMGGLTKKEFAGKLAFDQKPPAVKAAQIEAGKAVLRKLRLSAEDEIRRNH